MALSSEGGSLVTLRPGLIGTPEYMSHTRLPDSRLPATRPFKAERRMKRTFFI